MPTPIERYEQFKKMLQNPRKGNNGGNPNADLWFCGLENSPGSVEYAYEHNEKLLSDPEYQTMPNQDITGFNMAIKTILRELDLIPDVQTANEMYQSDKFYCANLFPFAMLTDKADEMNKMIFELTGLPGMNAYYNLSVLLRSQSAKWYTFSDKPKVIVCFSREYSSEFLTLFADSYQEMADMEKQILDCKTRGDRVCRATTDRRTVLICDHPSYMVRQGKDKMNEQLSEIANIIRNCMKA